MSIQSRVGHLFGPESPVLGALCKKLSASCRFTRTYAVSPVALLSDPRTDVVRGDGLEWGAGSRERSLTLPRPADYAGGGVTVRFFFRFGTDESGTLAIGITPVTLRSAGNFETYGGVSTPTMNAPESPLDPYELGAHISPGGTTGFGDGEWWFFRFTRQGTYPGPLRLMSIAVDYPARL